MEILTSKLRVGNPGETTNERERHSVVSLNWRLSHHYVPAGSELPLRALARSESYTVGFPQTEISSSRANSNLNRENKR